VPEDKRAKNRAHNHAYDERLRRVVARATLA
jgi:hypothetical protein